MMKCGLLGRKLGHSYSPQIHSMLGCYTYSLFEKEPHELEAFLRHGDFCGLNVTLPYKKEVIPYLDDLSPIAQKLGAVNTIARRSDGSLIGHNTDYFGFQTMVRQCAGPVCGEKTLVLGSGGASNTAVAVLEEMGAKVVVVSRQGKNNYQNLFVHSDARIIVNATPVGMYPQNGDSPIDLDLFPRVHTVMDVIYNPARTKLLMDAETKGNITAVNGLLMLVAQAKEAAEWFTGEPIDSGIITKIHAHLSRQMQNIVLVGMPGCGKSTIGKLLAERVNRPFADADAKIEELAGKSIPRIFSEDGEKVFRHWETKVLEELGKQSGLVIATGGGCVTREENYPLLHQNGKIFWLKRSIDALPTDGRPLSQHHNLAQLYLDRHNLYDAFSDCIIENNGTPEDAAVKILSDLEVCP